MDGRRLVSCTGCGYHWRVGVLQIGSWGRRPLHDVLFLIYGGYRDWSADHVMYPVARETVSVQRMLNDPS